MRARNPLNPEAGHVQSPEDPREVAAALRAGQVTQRLFPYYGWRYGARGEAFTRSDSAWLAWLAGHDQDRVDEQIAWLWSVLANRGMPGRLLEFHLRVLRRQLCRVVPAREAAHGRLSVAADGLAARRLAFMTDDAAEQVAARLPALLGLPAHRLLLGAGRLLVDAVADEGAGAANAVPSLTAWLADVDALRAAVGLADALSPPLRAALDADDADQRWAEAVAQVLDRARAATT